MKVKLFPVLLAAVAWAQAPPGWTPEVSMQVQPV